MMNFNGDPSKGTQALATGLNSSIQTASLGDQAMLTYMAPQQSQQQQQENFSQQQQQQQQIAGVDGLSSTTDDDDIIRFSADLQQLLDYASSNSCGGSARVSPKYYGNNGGSEEPLPAAERYNSVKVSTGAHSGTTTYTSVTTQPLHLHTQQTTNNPNSASDNKYVEASSTPSQLTLPPTIVGQLPAVAAPNQLMFKFQQPQLQTQPQPAVTQSWVVVASTPQGPIPTSPNLNSPTLLPTAFAAQTFTPVGQQQPPRPSFGAAPLSLTTVPQTLAPNQTAPNQTAPNPTIPNQTLSNITAKRTRRKSGKRRREGTNPQTTDEPDLPSSVSEDESEKHRRRLERNMREQERSHRITGQIAELRELLNEAKVRFKPDKYSTLASVSDYIQSLQKKSICLEDEHRKLLQTISKTNEIVNNTEMHGFNKTPVITNNMNIPPNQQPQVVPNRTNKSQFGDIFEDEFVSFCRGLDYKGVFFHCGTPICVTGVDGRILDCNEKFLTLFMMSRDELQSRSQDKSQKQLSIFNLIENKDMRTVFASMSNMLKNTDFLVDPIQNQQMKSDMGKLSQGSTVIQTHRFLQTDYWSGFTRQSIGPKATCRLNISLVRNPNGLPKFFNCSFTPVPSS